MTLQSPPERQLAATTTPETPAPPPPLPPQVIRRNYRLGVANGVLFALGDSLTSAGLVLALLVRQLGGSLALVGLLPALQSGGFLLPQLLVGGRLQAMTYKLPLYSRAAVVRLSTFLILTLVVFGAGIIPSSLSLWLLIICYMIFNLGGGTSTLAFQDVVAKIIPTRRRGSFFGTRQLMGGLLTFAVAGPLVRWLLGATGPLPFPYEFGVLCVLGLLFYTGGLYAFTLVQEPPQTRPATRLRMIEGLRRAPTIMREHSNYRWFIVSRMLTRGGQIAEPFYLLYATEALGLPPSVAGLYLALRAIAGALSNLLWGRVSERQGNRRLLLIAGALLALTPALALLGPVLARWLWPDPVGLTAAIGLVFLVSGIANDGSNIAGMTYLLEIVPEAERPTYIGLANTTLGLVTFLPVLGGWLVALIGYAGIFGVGLGFALLGLAAALPLTEADSMLTRRSRPIGGRGGV
jgi:MFS family permease